MEPWITIAATLGFSGVTSGVTAGWFMLRGKRIDATREDEARVLQSNRDTLEDARAQLAFERSRADEERERADRERRVADHERARARVYEKHIDAWQQGLRDGTIPPALDWPTAELRGLISDD